MGSHIGEIGVPIDHNEAKKWFEKSVESENPIGYRRLADINIHGYGVAQDYRKAYELYDKAGRCGDTFGLNAIADIYYKGYGVKKDYIKAKEYWQKSAEKGNRIACRFLGKLFEDGLGMDKPDYYQALKYYTLCKDRKLYSEFIGRNTKIIGEILRRTRKKFKIRRKTFKIGRRSRKIKSHVSDRGWTCISGGTREFQCI